MRDELTETRRTSNIGNTAVNCLLHHVFQCELLPSVLQHGQELCTESTLYFFTAQRKNMVAINVSENKVKYRHLVTCTGQNIIVTTIIIINDNDNDKKRNKNKSFKLQ